MKGDYTGQLRNPDLGRWIETDIITGFPYTQKVDWITKDMCPTGSVWDLSCENSLPTNNCVECESFDGGFTIRCDNSFEGEVRLCIAFSKA